MSITYSLYTTTYNTTDSAKPAKNGVAASGTSTYYSDVWVGNTDFGLSVFATSASSLTGTWTLWATDNPKASLTDDTDWVDMSSHSDVVEANPAGASAKWRVNGVNLRAYKFRLKYVNASGTGTLYAYVSFPKGS